MDAYPGIDTIPNKVAQMQKAGYIPVANFILIENCWIEHFYTPQINAQIVSCRKMLAIKPQLSLLRTSGMRLNYTLNTKNITAMYSI